MLTDLTRIMKELKALRLGAMATRLQEWMADETSSGKSQLDCIEALVLAQSQSRVNARERTFRRNTDATTQASLSGFENCMERGLPLHQRSNLATCQWVREGHSLIVTGPSFSGKSYLAMAFAREAVLAEYRTAYRRLPLLLVDYAIEKEQGPRALDRFFRTIQRPALLVLDDFALQKLTREQGQVVLQILDARERHDRALMVVSAKAPDQWHTSFADAETAEAVHRRVTARQHLIKLKGVFQRPMQSDHRGARFNPRPPVDLVDMGQRSETARSTAAVEKPLKRKQRKGSTAQANRSGDPGTSERGKTRPDYADRRSRVRK